MKPTGTRTIPLWIVGAAVTAGIYLLVAQVGYGFQGFPLDDAWIHQTYARNLAASGQWAFLPGQVSAGSTSPLWSLLLSLGYLLRLPYLLWTYGLGILFLGLAAWTAARLGADLLPARPGVSLLVGLMCLVEWHLVWAAVSGMETILFVWLALLTIWLWFSIAVRFDEKRDWDSTAGQDGPFFDRPWRRSCLLGLVGGLLVLTRPEGLLLVGLAGLALGWQTRHQLRTMLVLWAAMGAGLAVLLVPYVVFHTVTAGTPFPNTLYAKQQEYAALTTLYPVWRRLLMMAGVTLVGGQVLLLPGFVAGLVRSLGRRLPASTRYAVWLMGSWWLLHLLSYAMQLPVTYQHGRYQIPTIPVLLILGTWGSVELVAHIRQAMVARIVRRSLMSAAGLTFVAFLAVGARAYATDVGFIQGEMVATARWLEQNTDPDSLLAVHDIGAIGYFSQRKILDLAGLVTPEVIPFITDEDRLLEWMEHEHVDYVVVFPDWSTAYQRMVVDQRLVPVHRSGYQWTLDQGRSNMTVYRLLPDGLP